MYETLLGMPEFAVIVYQKYSFEEIILTERIHPPLLSLSSSYYTVTFFALSPPLLFSPTFFFTYIHHSLPLSHPPVSLSPLSSLSLLSSSPPSLPYLAQFFTGCHRRSCPAWPAASGHPYAGTAWSCRTCRCSHCRGCPLGPGTC